MRRIHGDVQLVADSSIWLVSVAFAQQLQGIVPSGSFTGGLVARAGQVSRHLEDLIASVEMSPRFFSEIAGVYATAIKENWRQIVGIVAGFILAEAASTLLAASPTGVGQLAAAVIQLGLAAFGAKGFIEASEGALKYAKAWILQAWAANGDAKTLQEASRSFLHMVVNIAMAALSMAGGMSNTGRALKLTQGLKFTPPRLVMMQIAGGGTVQALARLEKYTIDRGTNMIDMPAAKNPEGLIMHLGGHPKYSRYVGQMLDRATESALIKSGKKALDEVAPEAIDRALQKVEETLIREIKSNSLPPEVLKELIEDGILVGRKLALLEIRSEGEFSFA